MGSWGLVGLKRGQYLILRLVGILSLHLPLRLQLAGLKFKLCRDFQTCCRNLAIWRLLQLPHGQAGPGAGCADRRARLRLIAYFEARCLQLVATLASNASSSPQSSNSDSALTAAIFKLAIESFRSNGCRDSRAAQAGRRPAHAGRRACLRLGLHFEARCLQHSLRLKISLRSASKASNFAAISKSVKNAPETAEKRLKRYAHAIEHD